MLSSNSPLFSIGLRSTPAVLLACAMVAPLAVEAAPPDWRPFEPAAKGDSCSKPPLFDGLARVTNPSGNLCGRLHLDWPEASSSCGGSVVYNVFRSTEPDFEPSLENLLADCIDGTSFLDDTASLGVTYFYTVLAEDTFGSGTGTGFCASGPSDSHPRRLPGIATADVVDLFSDDLESGAGQWATGDFGDIGPWELVTHDSHSPIHSWFGADGDVCHKWLSLAEPLLIASRPSELEFYHRFNTELGFDGGVLEYSIDGGSEWRDILAGNLISFQEAQFPPSPPTELPPIQPDPDRFVAGGYNSSLANDHPDGDFANRPAWSGDSGPELTLVRVDLSDFAGYTMNFRWRIRCDAGPGIDGWYVDDVRIRFGNDCGGVFSDGFESGDLSLWAD